MGLHIRPPNLAFGSESSSDFSFSVQLRSRTQKREETDARAPGVRRVGSPLAREVDACTPRGDQRSSCGGATPPSTHHVTSETCLSSRGTRGQKGGFKGRDPATEGEKLSSPGGAREERRTVQGLRPRTQMRLGEDLLAGQGGWSWAEGRPSLSARRSAWAAWAAMGSVPGSEPRISLLWRPGDTGTQSRSRTGGWCHSDTGHIQGAQGGQAGSREGAMANPPRLANCVRGQRRGIVQARRA